MKTVTKEIIANEFNSLLTDYILHVDEIRPSTKARRVIENYYYYSNQFGIITDWLDEIQEIAYNLETEKLSK
jgi:hypothetical protein